MLTFTSAEAYDEKPTTKVNNYLWWCRNVWDGRENQHPRAYDKFVELLADKFPHALVPYKPMGYARDLLEAGVSTHEGIYADYVARIEKTLPDGTNIFSNLKAEAIGKYGKTLDVPQFIAAVSVWLYRMTKGIYLEFEVIKKLQDMYAAHDFLLIEGADNSLESRDVDAVVKDKATGKIIFHISIKNMGALSEKNISHYRSSPRKKLPSLYIGFEDSSRSKLKAIYPSGITREKLHKAIITRTPI